MEWRAMTTHGELQHLPTTITQHHAPLTHSPSTYTNAQTQRSLRLHLAAPFSTRQALSHAAPNSAARPPPPPPLLPPDPRLPPALAPAPPAPASLSLPRSLVHHKRQASSCRRHRHSLPFPRLSYPSGTRPSCSSQALGIQPLYKQKLPLPLQIRP